ncbi:MAG: UPF0280 family protein [Desulfovibrio sp.]|jgi:ApbE superfamily uncharacterized protein (UPF0280 family)|nr:UPF0280 family protein [Desulfovibrio sp.]
MKNHVRSGRFYRRHSPRPGERSFQVVIGQSDLWITVRADCATDMERLALDRVREARTQISNWVLLDPLFGTSLEPVSVPDHAPDLIRRMGRAASLMGVGPMAAVAGTVAAYAAETLSLESPDCLVENGGDSMLYSTCERVVALLPDPGRADALGLRLAPEAFPVSLCASSATFGHSLSFGRADLAVARAKDACLADAAATALCNMVSAPDDVGPVAGHASTLAPVGLEGVFLKCGDAIGIWGDMELASL